IQEGDQIFRQAVYLMNKDKTLLFAVCTGDMTPSGTKWEYDKYKSMTDASGIKFYNVLGNHDKYRGGIRNYEKLFGRPYYSWDSGGAHFIALENNSKNGLGSAQMSWLNADLEANKDKPKFIFMHKPLFDITGSFPDQVMKPETQARILMKVFEQNRVVAVFCGHIHGYAKEKVNGIVYIVTGGGGAHLHLPEFSGGYYHYTKASYDGRKFKNGTVKLSNE
ncbi:MAG: metallophosphoesterase, partial [Candidatus Margulisiibacteriota bacterium]